MTTSYENIIAVAKEMLELEGTSQYDSFFETRIDMGVRDMDVLTSLPVKECEIEVWDGAAQLPKNFVEFIGLDMNGLEGVMIDFRYLKEMKCRCSGGASYSDAMDIQEGYLVFRDPDRVPDGTKGCLAYVARRLDKFGRGVIDKEMELALQYWCMYQYMLKKRRIFPRTEREEIRRQYVIQKTGIHANVVARHFREHQREISAVMNAWPFSIHTY